MKFIADLHIHSHYSIATSRNLIPEHLEHWAGIKGINVVGTGDCTHPGWLNELKEKLEPAGNGFYNLKKDFRLKNVVRPKKNPKIHFVLTCEISSIYKKTGKVRKVHNICVLDCFDTAEKFQKRLAKIGNITSDGRPILGLDSKNLLEILLETSENSYLIPAHIWTPWFSVLGSKSGFDTINECYEDLTKYIFAVETGLSSDPRMNRQCSFLDRFNLVSNSDAHSPEKLGREANLFDTEFSYKGMFNALKTGKGFNGTIEFFPQEGKYHYDGHRQCKVCWSPYETIRNKGICPVCKKEVTKGVMYRVAELSDRNNPDTAPNRKEFLSIIPLNELLAEILNVQNCSSKKVKKEYFKIIEKLGSEFEVLLFTDIEKIKNSCGHMIAESIKRLRSGKVIIQEGYDGEFGRIKVFEKNELVNSGAALFPFETPDERKKEFAINDFKKEKKSVSLCNKPDHTAAIAKLTDEQEQAILHFEGQCMVLAGPGSGKTRVLTERVAYMVNEKNISQTNILCLTFSNKAAKEMRDRLEDKIPYCKVFISTFHGLGLSILEKYFEKVGRTRNFNLIDEVESREIIAELIKNKKAVTTALRAIRNFKQGLIWQYSSREHEQIFNEYNAKIQYENAFDLDDLIYLPAMLFGNAPEILDEYREKYKWILIDEYQDINARQYELITLLAGKINANIFVIGDPNQSIYGFRGSDIKFIELFKKEYPATGVIRLKNSFRCPDNIIKAGTDVLEKSNDFSGCPSNIKIHIQKCETENSEADWIASKIENMIGGTRSFSFESRMSDGTAKQGTESFSDFAILCRTTHMFEPIIVALCNHGIAYQVISAEPFFNMEPVKTAIASFKKIYYRKCKGQSPAHSRIQKMIMEKQPVSNILISLLEGEDISEQDISKLKTLTSDIAYGYDNFFKSIALRRSIDDYNEKVEAVTLMTLHAAKGLEFRTVFIPGCEQGIIPFELFGRKSGEELEEEKRLFYVGITRTKENLFLSYAGKRTFNGRLLLQRKSVFVDKIKDELLNFEIWPPKKRPGASQLDLF